MNTTERIVETYYRFVKKCFTVTDVKIIAGKGKQIDLFALDRHNNMAYHVETSVSLEEGWMPTLEQLTPTIKYKFMGHPSPRTNAGPKTDVARGINYLDNILDTYRAYGVDVRRVKRVICFWGVRATEQEQLKYLREQENVFGLPRNSLAILLFRDEVIPSLRDTVGKANYDDDILRTFSLLKQYELQTQKASS